MKCLCLKTLESPLWCWEKLIAPLQTFYSAGQVCIFKTKSMWTLDMLEVTQSLVLQFFMVLYYPAPSPIIMVPVQQCKMAVVISKVKILLEIDPFFAEAWIMASRLDDHSRSCFWHPVRAGRPTALWGQTMTFKMLTPVTPGWASSRVRGFPANLDFEQNSLWGSFPVKTFPTKIFWTELNS